MSSYIAIAITYVLKLEIEYVAGTNPTEPKGHHCY